MTGDDAALQREKAALRELHGQRRRNLATAAPGDAGARARDHLLSAFPPAPGAVVSAYWPLVGEFDVRAILHALHARGHPCGLPVTGRRGTPLTFRRWTPETALEIGAFRVAVPSADAEVLRPDVLLVPLLAVDRRGFRLGYGGGFYDRTLAALRADDGPRPRGIGIGFAGQVIERVPAGENDIALDAFVSERDAWRASGMSGEMDGE